MHTFFFDLIVPDDLTGDEESDRIFDLFGG